MYCQIMDHKTVIDVNDESMYDNHGPPREKLHDGNIVQARRSEWEKLMAHKIYKLYSCDVNG